MIGAVVIGRNEGARLAACLDSLMGVDRVVYVDSGSTDGSPELARARGVEVVALDLGQPFTAARARNAGLHALRATGDVEFVQFVDGDCTVDAAWIEAARAFLDAERCVAVVCGRRRERHPEASVYNAHCDREWNTPIGRAKACGGDAMMRMAALDEVGGFDPALIAGEEPELCVRLRANGWEVHRLDAEMTLHDAAITRFSQFWKRARRAGYAYANGAFLHGRAPERHYVSQTRRALFWGVGLPVAILASWAAFGSVSLLALLVYPLQILRLWWRGGRSRAALENAALLTVSKPAEALGVLTFYAHRVTRRKGRIIEYK